MRLNEAQLQAVRHLFGPMMVLAGPGSGKTTVICERITALIREGGADPSRILVVTFTKAAAAQMRSRFESMWDKKQPVSFGTFHSVFFTMLKAAYGYRSQDVLAEQKRLSLIGEIVDRLSPEQENRMEYVRSIAAEISRVKEEQPEMDYYYAQSCDYEVFRKIYAAYEQYLRTEHLLDFDDMMVLTKDLLTRRPDILDGWRQRFVYILIDEFQDINRLQYEIVKMLAAPLNNLFIVGDDDQSIYRFRGARPEFMLNFKKDYPAAKLVILEENYRSTEPIIRRAQAMIRHNKVRYDKHLRSAAASDSQAPDVDIRIYADPYEESRAIARELKERLTASGGQSVRTAVLYRINTDAGPLASLLMAEQIPFVMKDYLPNLFEHWIAMDLMAYIRLSGEPVSEQAKKRDLGRILNRPNRWLSRQLLSSDAGDEIHALLGQIRHMQGMEPYAMISYIRYAIGYEAWLKSYADDRRMDISDLMDILEQLTESARPYRTVKEWTDRIREYGKQLREMHAVRGDEEQAGITLSTIHNAKGLEYDEVYLIDCVEGVIPYHKAVLDPEIEEERRVFYVGMTRAARRLHLCCVRTRRHKEMEISRFINELSESRPGR